MNTTTPSLTWIGLTLLVYGITLFAYKRSGAHPLMLPVLTGTAIVIITLEITHTSYSVYLQAVSPLLLLIGPATVALAIPLAGQVARLKTIWWPVTVALFAGSLVATLSAVVIAWALGAPVNVLASLAPKSVTMPIATSLSEQYGGLIPLAAAAVAITGIAATMLSGMLIKLIPGKPNDEVRGFALGLSAHAIGVARAMQISDTAGAYAAMAMGLNGILTAVLLPAMFALIVLLSGAFH
jgi:putative effector of murein hydrolase